jgi:amino acid adenylation domain-containing protein
MQNETVAGFRLSPQQQRLWQAQPDGSAWQAQLVIRLDGTLDVEDLQSALNRAAARHEILRTGFHRRPGMKLSLQVIDDHSQPEWRMVDWSGAGDREARLDNLLRQERLRPLDFQHGPLLHAVLATGTPNCHWLVLTLPVLCADGPSLQVLADEIRSLYAGRADLVEQPLQYADFSEWQTQLLETKDADAESARAYWSRADRDAMPWLVLPFQRTLVPGEPFEPEEISVAIPGEVVRQAETLARSQEIRVSTLFLACWQALLGRLSGQTEFVVRWLPEDRKQEELQGALGLFTQALPLDVHLENLSFVDWLRRVRQTVREASQWQEFYPGAAIASPSIDFEHVTVPAPQTVGGVTFATDRRVCHLSHFALKLSLLQHPDGGLASFSYDPRAFNRAHVVRIAAYFERFLAGALRNPQTGVGSLEIQSAEEKHQLQVVFNQTAVDVPQTATIVQLFEEQVRKTPEQTALAFNGLQFTYAELNARANQLAHGLRRRGVGRNVPVGLCVERSADMVVGLLGILKAGGAYVPLHYELPKARLAYQLEETQAPLILTQERLRDQLPDLKGQVLCLDRDVAQWAGESAANPETTCIPDDLVYIIYTSGTTGVPKGVAVRHRNLVNYSLFIQTRLGLTPGVGLHFATVSTLSADLGNTSLFPALLSGVCLHVIRYETSMDGRGFARYLAEHPIDVLKITPSHLNALMMGGGPGVLPRRYLILGGEALTWDLVGRVQGAGSCVVLNHYGPTETTVGSLTYNLAETPQRRADSATVPIGRPIANTAVYVLDTYGQSVPQGVPGELYIGGAGVAAGYLNQAQQTAERFIPDPFNPQGEARLYRTGDRARFLPDGNVEFLGRLDGQVKIRGFRVEPAEVEDVLRRQPGIAQAVVVAHEDKAGEKRLAAYVVALAGGVVRVDELRSRLLEQLPDYMVPAVFVPLQRLPLTPNGKLDRRALPNPEQTRLGSDQAFMAARNPAEERLAAIWVEVLGLPRVSLQDDFFELGGHSLLAMQIISRVRQAFQVEVPLRTLFEFPTVAGMADAIGRLQAVTPALDAEVDRMLAELEGLSEEEIQKLLAAEVQGGQT